MVYSRFSSELGAMYGIPSWAQQTTWLGILEPEGHGRHRFLHFKPAGTLLCVRGLSYKVMGRSLSRTGVTAASVRQIAAVRLLRRHEAQALSLPTGLSMSAKAQGQAR